MSSRAIRAHATLVTAETTVSAMSVTIHQTHACTGNVIWMQRMDPITANALASGKARTAATVLLVVLALAGHMELASQMKLKDIHAIV